MDSLVAELRAERTGHVPDMSVPSRTGRMWCGACGIAYVWPCPTVRAPDTATVLAEAMNRATRYAWSVDGRGFFGVESLADAASAWKGEGRDATQDR